MKDVIMYSGIVTKVKGMRAKLLTPKDFESIANCNSVGEVVEFLKDKPAYAPVFEKMSETLYQRGNIEKVLEQSLYEDYSRIYRFAGMKQKEFIKGFWKQYEIALINYCLRIVFNHYEQPFDLEYKKEYFDKYSKISIEKLMTSGSIDELVENLAGTEYYEPLRRVKAAGEATLLDYNIALEQYYFIETWKHQRKSLNKKEQEFFTKDCGTKIDLLNLQWIYRAKKYYRMEPAEIYMMIIPIHYRLHLEEFKEMVEAPDEERFLALLRQSYYKKFPQDLSMEKIYKEILYKLYQADERKHPFSIAAVNTYLFLKEEEINKLTTALECIRYGLTPGETLEYIGGDRG